MPAFRTGHPRFRAVRTTGVAFAAGVQNISLPTVDYDDESGWDGTSYTLDRDGLWLLTLAAGWTGTVTGAQAARVQWSVNGVATDIVQCPAVTGDTGVCGVWLLELAAGDVLTPQGRRHTTGSSTLQGNSTHASIVRVGPKRWT